MDAPAPSLTEERDDAGVAVLVLNRPERLNSFTAADYRDLHQALVRHAADAETRVVLLTGVGRAFSVGADRSLLEGGDNTGDAGPEFFTLLDVLAGFEKPLVAAVNGFAVGFGCTMLLYADLVLVGASARLRFPFTALGMVPEAGSSALASTRMSPTEAHWAMLSSDWISSERAVAAGLALRAHADDELMPQALDAARAVAHHDPHAVAATKRLLVAGRAEIAKATVARELRALADLRQKAEQRG